MNNQGNFKNRKLLWEELAPSPELRQHAGPDSGAYTSIPTADATPLRPLKPRLGFARRTTENLEPAQSPEPLPQFDDDADFRPRRIRWRPRTTAGWALIAIAVLLIFGAVTTGAIVLRRQILANNRFNLATANNLQMTGATEVSKTELFPVFKQDIGHNVFQIPLSARRKELEQISWVQRATVMRVLPNQLRVSVVERTPVAFVRSTPEDQQIGLVDADGVLLKLPASLVSQRHYSFPVVTGVDAKDSLAERHKRMVVYMRLIRELDSGNRKFSEQISEIDLRDPNDARVLMPEAGADILAHFGSDHFLERYQTYQSHIAEWRQQYPKLSTVDLRYEQQVILRQSDDSSAAAPHPDQLAAAQSTQPTQTAQLALTTEPAQPASKSPEPKHGQKSDSMPVLNASVTSAPKMPDHQSVTKNSTPSKNDSTKSEKPSPTSAKVSIAPSNPAQNLAKSTHDSPKVIDATTSNSSTIHPQLSDGHVVKTVLPVEKTTSSKGAVKPSDNKAPSSTRDKKESTSKTKASSAKSKGNSKTSKKNSTSSKQKKAAGKTKPSVKKTSVQTTHSEHPTNQQ